MSAVRPPLSTKPELLPEDRVRLRLTDKKKTFDAQVFTAKRSEVGYLPSVPSSFACLGSFGKVSDRRRVRDGNKQPIPGRWILGKTPQTVEGLLENWPESQIEFYNNETHQAFTNLRLERASFSYIADRQIMWQAGEVEVEPFGELAPYQEFAAGLAAYTSGFALFMEQGTGKTATTIRALDLRYIQQGKPALFPVLVVAPKTVCFNWQLEVERWSQFDCLTMLPKATAFSIAREIEIASFFTKQSPGLHYVITSYGYVTRNVDRLVKCPWSSIILDESQKIKSPRTAISKACVDKLRDRAEHRMVLSGTPVGNSITDLYPQLEFLGEGYSGYSSARKFQQRFCEMEAGHDGIYRAVRDKSTEETKKMTETLIGLAFVIKKEEVLKDLPENTLTVETVELPEELQEAYRELETEVMLDCAKVMENLPGQLQASSILTLLLRLAQITSAIFVTDETDENDVLTKRHTTRYETSPKIERAVEIVQGMPVDEKALVWSCFTEPIEWACERFTEEGFNPVVLKGGLKPEDIKDRVNKFNTDESCRVLIGNPSAAGMGINLRGHDGQGNQKTDCTKSIFIAQNWSYFDWSQAMARKHRRGTRRPTESVALLCPNTIDTTIYKRLTKKQGLADSTLNVREILEELAEHVR